MNFIYRDFDGNILDIDGVKISTEDNPERLDIEIYGRKSDGLIALSACENLVVRPRAANCAYVSSERDPLIRQAKK